MCPPYNIVKGAPLGPLAIWTIPTGGGSVGGGGGGGWLMMWPNGWEYPPLRLPLRFVEPVLLLGPVLECCDPLPPT